MGYSRRCATEGPAAAPPWHGEGVCHAESVRPPTVGIDLQPTPHRGPGPGQVAAGRPTATAAAAAPLAAGRARGTGRTGVRRRGRGRVVRLHLPRVGGALGDRLGEPAAVRKATALP